MTTKPDKWLLLKITPNDSEEQVYKVFATWFGSYLSGSSWRMNSGVMSARLENDYIVFTGHSGSEYWCLINGYGCTGYGRSVLGEFIENAKPHAKIEVMDEKTDWMALNYT